MNVNWHRKTSPSRSAGVVRLLLAAVFLMTGAMKLLVPALGEAWSGQLLAADLPLYSLTRWAVPLVEIAVGVLLALGLFTRLAAATVIVIMFVATYVHLVVDDPSLFPLQPSRPIIPVVVIVMAAYLLCRGGGAWSRDIKAMARTGSS